ncbi:polysaccharide deacetylase family protein [Phytohabitans sp. ZYX-F-186]|uniref:Polysaccharide deacetylase family protein n=1 Tax=Phytohabitans maris TaxID=3071409 RepID=A0ABU0ZDT0_9ACTN|nr:polysaccharide deacetylase family protein [Phytohabitans sp. ZYX-F-186]MDQ7905200.1 polysaccharide deacetylase family protein [Phytohabitans sp. ZYX-F-186]
MTGEAVRHEDGTPRWPDGYGCAALVTVNFDAEALLLAEPGMAGRQKTLSVLRYGATRGAGRLLDALAAAGVPSTWFTPAVTAEEHPGVVRDAVRSGHAVGLRGYAYEPLDRMPAAERTERLARAAELLQAVTGEPARGFRLPVGEWPPSLAAELARLGVAWSSSWYGDDTPFTLEAGAGRSIVEFPVHHALDDRIAFYWNVNPPIPAGQSRISPYGEVLENWLLELEGCRREGLLFVLQLHPEICGTPGRIGLVEELLATLAADPSVWRPTGDELARWWAAAHPANPPGHPADVFFDTSDPGALGRAGIRESETTR